MRHHAAHYSRAVQIGLALSVAVAVGLGGWAAVRAKSDPRIVTLAIGDLRARSAELVAMIDERRTGRATGPFIRAQVTQWSRVVRDVHGELAAASLDDSSGDAARAESEVRALLALADALRAPHAPGDDSARAAAQITQRLVALERGRPR